MTATVTTGTTTRLTGGTVTFRDTYGGVAQVLGTVQVQSANGTKGNAVLRAQLGGIGTHSIVATFNGTKTFAPSPSAAVSATTTGVYPTVASLVQTGGTTGNFSLTTTIVGVGSFSLSPTGNVSLLDTSNSNLLLGVAGLGAGTFGQQTVVAAGSPIGVGDNPQDVVAGDFDNDGNIDLAVLNSRDKTISILIGDGAGGFTATRTYGTGNGPVAIVAGDFDGDGNLDLAVANSSDQTVWIRLGNGNGTFSGSSSSYATPTLTKSLTALALGDFNGDGILDLIVAGTTNNAGAGAVNILQGNGNGNGNGAFANVTPGGIAVGNGPSAVVTGDFNGDGNLDFAVANLTDNTISVMKGGTTFTAATGSPFSTGAGSNPAAIAIADFNRDGQPDLAVVESNKNRVDIFKGNGDATFTLLTPATATGTQPVSIVAGDFNADGKVDFAVTNQSGNSTTIMLGTGTGTVFTAANGSPFATDSHTTFSPVAIAAADFNGDGSADLAVVNSSRDNVGILLNQLTDTASASFTGIFVPGNGNQHTVEASYAGDHNFASSTDTLSLMSSKVPTSTLLSANTTSPTFGQQLVLTATLQTSPTNVGGLRPTGNVTFKDNGTTIGTPVAVAGGVATLNITSLGVGNHSITATYAGDTNFVTSVSPALGVIVGKATPVITWPTPSPISYETLLSSTQLNATTTVAGTFAYSQALYTLLPVGNYTISTTFIPTDSTDYTIATSSVTLVVNPATPQINWPTPAPISFGTPLSGIQLDATVAVYNVVPLTSSYNVNGIYTDRSSFSTGGFDGTGAAYSSNLLGTSVTWNNITYPLGPTNAPDAVANTTVPLPAGHYTTLNLLGGLVNGNVTTASTFVVTYTDGTTTTVSQHLSDWVFPLNYAGETVITCVPYRNTSNGTTDAHLTCVFGYQIALDSTKIVQSVTLPGTRNNVFLAMSLVTPPIPGTLVYNPPSGTVLPTGENTLSATFTPTDLTDFTSATASVQELVNPANTVNMVWPTPASITYGTALSSTQLNAVAQTIPGTTSVLLSSYYRVNAFQSDGSIFSTGGFDNNGNAYSSNLLDSSVVWNGETFSLGSANLPSAVTSTAIALPQGNFAKMSLIGAATTTGQTAQPFTITYTDGTTSTVNISLSSWTQSAGYPGESIVSTTPYRNTGGGGRTIGNTYLYGYQITLDSTKVVQSVTLPNNRNIVIVAMSLDTSSTPTAIPGTYTYTPPAGTVPPVGTVPLSVLFTATDPTYGTATKTVNLVVTKAPLTVTAVSQTIAFGSPVAPYTDSITGFVNGDAPSVVTGAASLTTAPTTPTAPGAYTITAANGTLAASNYSFTFVNGTLTITKATPTVTWNTPAAITYGTPLTTAGQLNASASVAGTFSYSPALGTVLSAGSHTLSVTFTPTNTTDYAPQTATVTLVVDQAVLTVTAANQTIAYGTTAAPYTATITGYVNGDTSSAVTGTPSLTTSPATPTAVGSYPITPAQGTLAAANYSFTYLSTGSLTITTGTATVSWPSPASIVYGTALSATQLNATASVPGAFAYTPATGTVLSAGSHSLSVTFTPTDTGYAPVTQTTTISVTRAVLTVTAVSQTIAYGTTAAPYTATITGYVNGDTSSAVTGTPSLTTSPATPTAVGSYPITPAQGTLAAANYSFTYLSTGSLTITTGTATVSWPSPASIVYGTALSATQLNATASVPGAFAYTPATGTVLSAGSHSLSVTFTPTDTGYAPVTQTTTISVTRAVLTVTAVSQTIAYGTTAAPYTATITGYVNGDTSSAVTGTPSLTTSPATPTAVGSYPITPAQGTLAAANYSFTYLSTGSLTITTGTATVSWPSPASIVYGTALSATQLNATASVPGAFAYTPATGTVLSAGSHSLSVTFTPTDTGYAPVTQTTTISVTRAVLTVTAVSQTIAYGTTAAPYTATITGYVNGDTSSAVTGTPSLTTSPATPTAVGSYPITPAQGTLAAANYSFTYLSTGSLTITTGTATVSWPSPASIVYGTALSATQLNATASVPGAFAYTPATGTVLSAGSHSLSVTFTPTDTGYAPVTQTTTISVTRAVLTVTAVSQTIAYGTTAAPYTATITGYVNGDTSSAVTGTPSLTTSPATPTAVGSYPITPAQGTLAAANYSFTYLSTGSLTITTGTATVSWPSPASIVYGTALSATQLNATASVPGAFAYTPATGTVLSAGSHSLSVTFTPTDTGYAPVTQTTTISVTRAVLTVTAVSQTIAYGTTAAPYTATITGYVNGDTSSAVTGTPSLTTSPATPTAVGSYPITPAQGTLAAANYSFTYLSTGSLTITTGTATVSWPSPASIVYGTALSATQLNATASVPGAFAYTPATGTVLSAGSHSLSVTFTPTDTGYAPVTQTTTISVTRAVLTVTAVSQTIAYGTTAAPYTATITGYVNGDTSSAVTGTPSLTTSPATPTAVGSYPITPAQGTLAAANYSFTYLSTGSLTITTGTATVSWPSPASIVYGTALSATQLNATASVPGAFAYTPATGTVLSAGSHSLSVTFTPTDTGYAPVTQTTTISVTRAVLTVTAVSQTIAYGTTAAPYTATITGYVNGDTSSAVTGTPSLTTSPATPTAVGSYPITPAQGTLAAANYSFTYLSTGSLTITTGTATVSWPSPASIVYGTALSATQLNATASVPGAFAYTPATGTVLSAGSHSLSVTFTPTDTGYAPVTQTTTISVTRAVLTVTAVSQTIAYGTTAAPYTATITGYVNGDTSSAVTGTPSLTTSPATPTAVGSYPITPAQGTLAAANYSFTYLSTGSLTITTGTATVSWPSPASIVYGTALSATQLNATASVPGAFAYTPATGTVLSAGSHSLSVTFTPTDTGYAPVTQTTTISVTRAVLTVTAVSQTIAYGTTAAPYTATITGYVNGDTSSAVTGTPSLTTSPATPTAVGSYPITPAQGTLAAANYSFTYLSTGSLTITTGTATVSWPSPASIVYGTALSATQLNATASVPGAFAYTPATGTVLSAGSHSLSVTFTPTDTGYAPVTQTTTISVTRAVLTVTAVSQTIAYGTTAAPYTATITGYVNGDTSSAVTGTPSLTTSPATPTAVGSYPITPAQGTLAAANYSFTYLSTGSLTITTGTATVSWPSPASIVYGTALSATQLNATASVPGAFAYTPATGTVLSAGSHSLSVTFTPTDTGYAPVTQTTTISVTRAVLTVTAVSQTIAYGTTAAPYTATITGYVNGDTSSAVTGTPSLTTSPATPTAVGSYPITPAQGTLAAANYSFTYLSTGSLTITTGTATVSWPSPASIVYGTALSATQLNATASVPGAFAYTPATGTVLSAGSHSLSVTFTPTDTGYAPVTQTTTISVTRAVLTVTAVSQTIAYGTTAAPYTATITGYVNGDTSSAVTGTPSLTTSPATPTAVGSYPITPAQGTLAAANYSFTYLSTGSLTITTGTATVSWPSPASIVYGTALSATQLNATASVPGAFAYTPATGTVLSAGSHSLSVTFTPTDTGYAPVTQTTTISVTRAVLTVTAVSQTIAYGTTAAPYTATITGYVNGDTSSAVTGTPSLTTSPATPTAVGSYPITPAQGTLAAANYSFTYLSTGSLTITTGTATVSWPSPASIVYGTALSATQLNATASVPGAFAYTPATGTVLSAGSHSLSVTFTPTDTGYAPVTQTTTISVTRAVLTVTAVSQTIAYGTTAAPYTATITGYVNGDTSSAVTGTPSLTTSPATPTAVGSYPITPAQGTLAAANYSFTYLSTGSLTITTGTATVSWPSPASIVYGTALSATQLNATASVPGAFAYTPATGTVLSAGSHSLSVTFTPTDTGYAPVTQTTTISVTRAVLTVTAVSQTIAYGTTAAPYTATITGYVNGDTSSAVTGTPSLTTSPATPTAVGSYPITPAQGTLAAANYSFTYLSTGSLTITTGTATVSWPSPASIVYGTALSATQLNATASVPGAFAYTPATGTVLSAGSHSLSVTFTPTDTGYAPVTQTTTISVTRAVLTVTAVSQTIAYGTTAAPYTATITGYVNGDTSSAVTGTPSLTTSPATPTAVGSYPITPAQGTLAAANYSFTYLSTGSLTITTGTATVSWPSPASIVYGTALSATQLNATASVPGAFAYTPATGTVLSAGSHSLSVTFTPTDTGYAPVTQTTTISVTRAVLTVTAVSQTIAYGTTAAPYTATITGYVNGDTSSAVTGTPSLTTSPATPTAVGSYPITPAQGTLAAANYSFTYLSTGSLTITTGTATVSWPSPASIVYGTALSATQLNATASVPGAFAYTPATGTVLSAGSHSLSVTFTPTDTGYAPVTQTTTISVTRAVLTVTAVSQTIAYGTTAAPYTATITGYVNGDTSSAVTGTPSLTTSPATPTAVGSYPITPAQGTLAAANYSFTYLSTGSLTITTGTATVSWPSPASIVYGTALSATQLNATASVPGAFAYTPATGTVLSAGSHSLSVTFTPTDTGYAPVTQTTTISVTRAVLTVTAVSQTIAYGTTAAPYTATITGYVNGDTSSAVTGTPSLTTSPATPTAVGSYPITPAQGTLAAANYSFTYLSTGSLTITTGTATVSWPSPASIVYGTALSATQLNATASVPGAFAYTPATGTVLSAGSHSLSVTFTPTDTGYAPVTQTTTISVTRAVLTVTAVSQTIAYGTTAAPYTATITGYVNGDTSSAVTGTPSLTTSPATPTAVGSYPITPAQGTLAAANYSFTYLSTGSLTITTGTATVSWPSPASIVYGTALSATQLNATASVPGAFAYTPATGTVLSAGSHSLSVTFTPTDTGYAPVTQTTTISVTRAVLTVTAVSQTIAYGTTAAPYTATITGYVNGDTSSAVTGTPSLTTSPATPTAVGSYPITPAQGTLAAANYSFTYLSTGSLTITTGTATVSWPSPASIVYGTALSATQLNATASVPGAFAYTPATGTVLSAGSHSLSVTFTPTDTGYAPVTQTTTISVTRAVLTVTAVSQTIAYGTTAAPYTATITGYVNGDTSSAVTGTPSLTTSPATPTAVGSYPITPAQGTLAAANYSFTYLSTGSLTITTGTATVSWPSPASIVYGTALSATQLNATASVPGAFAYTPATGTVLSAGSHSLSVTFTPTDTGYAPVTQTTTISVTRAVLTVTAVSQTIAYGTTAAPYTATITGYVNGDTSSAVTGTPSLTTSPATPTAVGSYPITPAQGTLAAANYSFTYLSTGSLTITTGTATVSWPSPASIVYGTALSATQLNATASVPGAFAYTPATGTVLSAGSHSLSVTFTPTDTGYAPVTQTTTISVTRAVLTVTAVSQTIAYGTTAAPYTATITGYVNGDTSSAVTGTPSLTTSPATPTAVGSYPITPAQGTLAAANYSFTYLSTGSLTITTGTATVSWPSPASIVYGTALSATQLNATASVPGAFAYTPATGTVLSAGSHSLSVTFTPTDTGYAPVTQTTTISVTRAVLTVTAVSQTIAYGTTAAPYTATITGYVNGDTSSAVTGTPSLTTSPATPTAVGSYPITPAQGTLAAANYSFTYLSTGSLTITTGTATVSWPSPASIVYGTALSATQLNATASVPGAFAYTPATGTVLSAGSHSLSVTFTPTDTGYAPVTQTTTISVTRAVLTVTAVSQTIAYGTTAAPYTATITGYVNGDTSSAVTGTPSLTTSPATPTAVGSYPITPAQGTLAAANYSFTYLSTGSLTITTGTATVSWPSPASIVYGTALSATQLNATASVPGAFAYTPATGTVLSAGSHSLSVTFTPDRHRLRSGDPDHDHQRDQGGADGDGGQPDDRLRDDGGSLHRDHHRVCERGHLVGGDGHAVPDDESCDPDGCGELPHHPGPGDAGCCELQLHLPEHGEPDHHHGDRDGQLAESCVDRLRDGPVGDAAERDGIGTRRVRLHPGDGDGALRRQP